MLRMMFSRYISTVTNNLKNGMPKVDVPKYIDAESAPSYLESIKAYRAAKEQLENRDLSAAKQQISTALKKASEISHQSPATASYVRAILALQAEIEQSSTSNNMRLK